MIISIAAIRKHLALPKTSWQICLLAIIGGCASALLVVLFTLTIEEIQQFYLIKRDNYNSLDEVSRFDLPIIGALIILLFGWITGYKYLRTGIPFVLHQLKVAHGVIPFKNTLNQFWGSAVALASGFSVGREGPAVHLGAACSSYLGSVLKLPYNSVRTLCACGIAAGIAATFNTPIAAVIFVMEVIMREYKVHIFVPVMLAAIVGSLITRSVFGSSHNFQYFQTIALEQHHYFSLVLLAIGLGLLAAAFNKYLVLIIKHSVKYHIVPRLMLAALITGSLGYLVPSAMGTGTSAIDISFTNNLQLGLLFSLLIAKLLMTMFALGLGIPGGIIGPTLGIGAIAGACAGALVTQIIPGVNLGSDFILMGMAGFMAASLNAPLAALLAVVELSGQLELVVPAMIVISIASIVSRQFCNNQSIFTMQLDAQNLLYSKPPIEESLQNIGALAVMKDDLLILEQATTRSITGALLERSETQIVINKEPVHASSTNHYYWAQLDTEIPDDEGEDVEHNLAKKLILHKLIPLNHQATLAEAYLALVEQRSGAVYIYHKNIDDCIGIVTFEQLRIYLVEGTLI
ncbi:chloride channel protein [Colwellia psychrerythraea]|uniref:Cl-channel voltage-gated family protein n=1 Tax=Colwellia psychrerythraea TaxID=28229 RepID=A0A099KLM7_COLPS|nr:chloride channel protein [Colwellia psychrerythraea]KGJ91649.1 Cl- channel voltage-gated family protein [Colwellia psychrerythraea]